MTQTVDNPRGGGLKYDGDKPRTGLLTYGCPLAILGVASVLTYGAKKYEAHSWKKVENNWERYWDAKERHELAIASGEEIDPESGLPHIFHVACNAMFLAELYAERKKNEPKYEVSLTPAPPRRVEISGLLR